MSSVITRQRSTESDREENNSATLSSVLPSSVDVAVDDRPVFCLNEEQRKMKTFHERKTDLDAAIEWIVKEIKFLKQQDQNLMRQFVKLRGVLNSVKNRPLPPPPIDRKISLPVTSPSSPLSPLYRISENSPETYYRDEVSLGLRRRAHSDFAGSLPYDYPSSPLSFGETDFSSEKFEHFAI